MSQPSLYSAEAAILARLAAKCAPGSVLLGTLQHVDLTDDSTNPVAGKLQLYRLDPTSQTGRNARMALAFAFSVFVDTARADATQQEAAFDLLEAAGNALTGWEITDGRALQIIPGPENSVGDRITRLSIAFTLPAHFVGTL